MSKKSIPVLILFVILLILFIHIKTDEENMELKNMSISKLENLTITTVYDNYKERVNLKTGWGFSCLIETNDENILFDTGADSETLLSNMRKMKVNIEDLDDIILSHRHKDHVGGLSGLLNENSNVSVYLLKSFPEKIKRLVEGSNAKMFELSSPEKLGEFFASTGSISGPPDEQSLILNTKKGLIIITGCAHPGVVDIIEKAKRMTGEDIYLVLGGLHLSRAPEKRIKNIIDSFRELKVKKAAPCHCSGDRARELFKKEYGEDYIDNGVGKKIVIN